MNFEKIEKKHIKLINISKEYMNIIKDKEHDINHINDVVYYTKRILECTSDQVNEEACIISAYWHDVGRIKIGNGHEKLSAEMLKAEMEKCKYDKKFIEECYKTIEFHKWNMMPTTIEGLILKDADKLAWLRKRKMGKLS